MKTRVLLLVSLLLNICLVIVALRQKPTRDQQVSGADQPTRVIRAYSAPQTNSSSPRFNWQSVEADDYQVYISNLRAIGCPDETIQDIVIADVCKLFEEKKRRLCATLPKIEYWKTSTRSASWTLENDAIETYVKLTQPVDAERNALLRTLGIDPSAHQLPASEIDSRELLLDFLPEDKRRKLTRLYASFSDEAKALQANTTLENRAEAFQKYRIECDERIKQLLTPEEALEYDLRFSATANAMRASLGGFDPTESEFVAIYKLRKPYDDARIAEMPERGGLPVGQVQAAKEALDQQIKNLLGESRFADYDRIDDYGFQQLYKTTQKAGLPSTVAVSAFGIQRAAMAKAYELRQGNLDKAVLERVLADIRDETERTLQSTLGTEAWNNYLHNGVALSWLNTISYRE